MQLVQQGTTWNFLVIHSLIRWKKETQNIDSNIHRSKKIPLPNQLFFKGSSGEFLGVLVCAARFVVCLRWLFGDAVHGSDERWSTKTNGAKHKKKRVKYITGSCREMSWAPVFVFHVLRGYHVCFLVASQIRDGKFNKPWTMNYLVSWIQAANLNHLLITGWKVLRQFIIRFLE